MYNINNISPQTIMKPRVMAMGLKTCRGLYSEWPEHLVN